MERKKSLKIVIPVFNEESELEKSALTLADYLKKHLSEFSWQIVIVDNASTDRTLEIAQRLAKKQAFIQVIHLAEKGRGRAVKHAWQHDKADIAVYMDVDLSTDLKHIAPLVQSLLRGYDLAIGSRNMNGSRVYGRNLLRTITSKSYIFLIKLFFRVNFSDAQCGFKAVTRQIVDNLMPYIKDNEWFFDTEMLILAEKSGYRIYEESVTWIDNPGSTVRVWKTAQGDLRGLWRLFMTRPWRDKSLWKKSISH